MQSFPLIYPFDLFHPDGYFRSPGGSDQHTRWFLRKLNRKFDTLEAFIMPSKNTRKGSDFGFPASTFIDVKLAGKTADGFEKYFSTNHETLTEELVLLIGSGFKASFSFDERNGCFMASLTCRIEKSVNNGCVVTSRSDDWFEALMMSVYKINHILGDSAWSDEKTGNSWG